MIEGEKPSSRPRPRGALEPSWQSRLGAELDSGYMVQLKEFLRQQNRLGKQILPAPSDWFAAFNSTPFEKVKVVILGQDPYHGIGQAHGLSFSVPEGVEIPPSLRNMYQELVNDVGIPMPTHGCLTTWAEQGVLLLNATLTVEQGQAGSHQNRGWELFTDRIIQELNDHREHLVFLLWGSYAQKKGAMIDSTRHLVLKAPHPSPLSAYRGFFGCRHFSKTNHYLRSHGITEIDWSIPQAS